MLPAAGSLKPRKAKAKPTPRMPDGKPDLSGFWQGPLLRNMFESVGGAPLNAAGEAAYRYNMTQSVNPEGLCLFAGIPRASISGVPFEIRAKLEPPGVPVRADDRMALDPH